MLDALFGLLRGGARDNWRQRKALPKGRAGRAYAKRMHRRKWGKPRTPQQGMVSARLCANVHPCEARRRAAREAGAA